MTDDDFAEVREWVLSRPPDVQDVLREFPPGCVVSPANPGTCTIPDDFNPAQVVAYADPPTVRVAGMMFGMVPHEALCDSALLRVVEEGPVTKALIAEWLA